MTGKTSFIDRKASHAEKFGFERIWPENGVHFAGTSHGEFPLPSSARETLRDLQSPDSSMTVYVVCHCCL